MKLNIYLATSDYSKHIIPFVSFLWNKYYNNDGELIYMGYKQPDFKIPSNSKFISLNPTRENFKFWSHYIRKYLQTLSDELIVFICDDNTIVSETDQDLLDKALDYMIKNMENKHEKI